MWAVAERAKVARVARARVAVVTQASAVAVAVAARSGEDLAEEGGGEGRQRAAEPGERGVQLEHRAQLQTDEGAQRHLGFWRGVRVGRLQVCASLATPRRPRDADSRVLPATAEL